jgi:hypothetical protein
LLKKSAIWHVKHLGAQGMGLRGMSQGEFETKYSLFIWSV